MTVNIRKGMCTDCPEPMWTMVLGESLAVPGANPLVARCQGGLGLWGRVATSVVQQLFDLEALHCFNN